MLTLQVYYETIRNDGLKEIFYIFFIFMRNSLELIYLFICLCMRDFYSDALPQADSYTKSTPSAYG